MADDWDYQKEFNHRQKSQEKLRDDFNTHHDNQVNQDCLEAEAARNKLAERQIGFEKEAEKEARLENNFHNEMMNVKEKRQNVNIHGRETARIEAEDERLALAANFAQKKAKEGLESQILLSQNEAATLVANKKRFETHRNQVCIKSNEL